MNTVFIHSSVNQMTLYDRVSKLLESFEWSDCAFRVGSEIIRAHKLILAISSPVFKVMLYGPLASDSKDIIISDIDPDVFQLLIDFIYKDKVEIDSLETACGLLYAAKKYMLPYLIEVCINSIKDFLNINNVLSALPFAEWIQEEALVKHCLTLICKYPEYILTEDADHMMSSSLQRILQQNNINMSEKKLIEFAYRWAHDECVERKINPSFDNKRMILTETSNFPLLRFYALSLDDLSWLIDENILTKEETVILEKLLCLKKYTKEYTVDENYINKEINVMNTNNESLKIPINFTLTSRIPIQIQWGFCFRPLIRSATPLIIQEGFQNIKVQISSQKTLFIYGLIIPTRQSNEVNFANDNANNIYEENIDLKLYNVDNEEECMTSKCKTQVKYNATANIDFSKPFIFTEGGLYTVSFTWPELTSTQYKYALSYRPIMSADGNFTFDDNFEDTLPCGSFIEGLKICM